MKTGIYILMTMLGIVFSGCNNWLDVRPETEQKEEDQFASYKGFRDALTGCYMELGSTDIYGERLTMSNIESLANLWQTSSSASGNRLQDYYLSIHDYTNDNARTAMQAVWSNLFNVITQTNMIIKHARENEGAFPDEATRSIILGEALAIRAYCQFDVLRLFGQLPQNATIQVNLPYSKITAFDERPDYLSFDAYVQELDNDLQEAEELLKDNDPIFAYSFDDLNDTGDLLDDDFMYYRQFRLNYWAVKGLQARMNLYLGRKDKAYEAAIAIVNGEDVDGNPVRSLSGTSDIVENGYKACPNECLFMLSKPDVKTVASFLVGGGDGQVRTDNLYITLEQLNELYEGQDIESHNRYRYVWNKSLMDTYDNAVAATLKYWFSDDAANQMLNLQVIPMIRMSEVYLIAIETTTDLKEANKLYADYMLSHDVVVGDAFVSLEEIPAAMIEEYRREFYGEGQMFYMYKRNNAETILWNPEQMSEEDYVLWECVSTEFNA